MDIWRKKIPVQFDIFDITIFLYIVTLLIVSFIQDAPIVGIIYGLRYDTVFLLAFTIFRRALPMW